MTGQKKRTYLGLMLVCGIALVVDRCVKPETATAPEPAAAGILPAGSPPEAGPLLSIPELPFPEGINSFDPPPDWRDLFAPPRRPARQSETSKASDKPPARPASPSGPGKAGREGFVTQHTLNGVMIDERLRIAIVDGKWLTEGRSVDGCILTRLTGREVQFECSDGVASLKLDSGEGSLAD